MSHQNLERLMHEARAISNLARAATWRALVTARQIEKLVRRNAGQIESSSDFGIYLLRVEQGIRGVSRGLGDDVGVDIALVLSKVPLV
jgi:hypothetical protein